MTMVQLRVLDNSKLTQLENTLGKAYFKCSSGLLYKMDCLEFLKNIDSNSIKMIFADPPYNIGKAEWDKWSSMDDYLQWCKNWISEAYRILEDEGTLMIMGFSEVLAYVQVISANNFPFCRWLIWHYKNKPNLSDKDWVRSHEAILLLRKSKNFYFDNSRIREPYNVHTKKYPVRSQGLSSQYGSINGDEKSLWEPNGIGAKPKDVLEIPAVNNPSKENLPFPTQKPEELMRKLILSATADNDIVLDPFGGSGSTYAAAHQLHRYWLGLEINEHYCELITKRLLELEENPKSPDYWLNLDTKRRTHRDKVRYG